MRRRTPGFARGRVPPSPPTLPSGDVRPGRYSKKDTLEYACAHHQRVCVMRRRGRAVTVPGCLSVPLLSVTHSQWRWCPRAHVLFRRRGGWINLQYNRRVSKQLQTHYGSPVGEHCHGVSPLRKASVFCIGVNIESEKASKWGERQNRGERKQVTSFFFGW